MGCSVVVSRVHGSYQQYHARLSWLYPGLHPFWASSLALTYWHFECNPKPYRVDKNFFIGALLKTHQCQN